MEAWKNPAFQISRGVQGYARATHLLYSATVEAPIARCALRVRYLRSTLILITRNINERWIPIVPLAARFYINMDYHLTPSSNPLTWNINIFGKILVIVQGKYQCARTNNFRTKIQVTVPRSSFSRRCRLASTAVVSLCLVFWVY